MAVCAARGGAGAFHSGSARAAPRRAAACSAVAPVTRGSGGRRFRVDGGTEQFPLADITTHREATVPYTAAADGKEREVRSAHVLT